MAEKTRANPDYSKTAVNLVNPIEVGERIRLLQDMQKSLATLKASLEAYPEYNEMKEQEKAVATIRADIETMVDAQGSYQDVLAGMYAVKYGRISKSYDAECFKANFSKFVSAVVVEQVNVKALEGLVKGGLVTEEALRTHNVLIENKTYAYFIR